MDEFSLTPTHYLNDTTGYEATVAEINFTKRIGMHYPSNQEMKQISQFIYDYFCPTFAIIGIVSNLATLLTLLRPPMSGFSVSVYLSAYCLFAILQWTFIIGLDWLLETVDYRHFRDISPISCRVYSFFQRMISFSCCWFVTGSAIDRVIVLWLPRKTQSFCTAFMAKNAIAFIIIGLTVVCIHAMWTHSLDSNNGFGHCYFEREDFAIYWLYTSNFLLSWLPYILLFVLSNMMIIRLCLKHQGRQIPDITRNEMELTYIVVIFSFVNFVLALPINIVFLLQMINRNNNSYLRNLEVPLEFATYVLWLSYSCIFFVVVSRSSAFRETLKEAVTDCAKIFTRRSSNIELQMIKDEYDQVPSTSTSV